MISPAAAAARMIKGSCIFLNLNNKNIVMIAITAAVQSVNCLFPKTNTAPIIAPMAAAVTSSTKALIPGCFPYFLKQLQDRCQIRKHPL